MDRQIDGPVHCTDRSTDSRQQQIDRAELARSGLAGREEQASPAMLVASRANGHVAHGRLAHEDDCAAARK